MRELENVLERAMVLGSSEVICRQDLTMDAVGSAPAPPRDLKGAVRSFERQHLLDVLAETGSDKREAAQVLGISLASLYRKLNLGSLPDEPAVE